MKQTMWATAALLAATVSVTGTAFAAAPATRLSLEPGTISDGATAEWVKKNGNGKGQGAGNSVLTLAKNVPTGEFEAAGADIGGVAGMPVGELTGLAWDVVGGSTTGGSPRWNIYLADEDSNSDGVIDIEDINGVVFLGADAAGEDGVFTAEEIQDAVEAAGFDGNAFIAYLQIIVDEEGSVQLDNIAVELGGKSTVFTGPEKSNRGGARIFGDRAE